MTVVDTTTGEIVPASGFTSTQLSPAQVKARAEWVRDVTRAALVEGTDFGTIPGTEKPTLLKPGAEMLLLAAGLGFSILKVDDDDARAHQGVTYRCTVRRGDLIVAECDGYAGYDESRFYTSAEQAEAKERANASRYQRPVRPDRFVEFRAPWNSVIKMAQKRALVGAALNAVAGSGLFTQDVDDDAHPATPAASFDPIPVLKPYLDRLDRDGKKELSEWRRTNELPDPRQMDLEQTAAVLVKIGALLDAQAPTQGGGDDGPGGKGTPAPDSEDGEQGGPSDTDDAGEPGPESPPDSQQETSPAPGDHGSSAAPGRDALTKPIGSKRGQQLHRQLGVLTFPKPEQDDLIFCESMGRTTHASELTPQEEARVLALANDIRAGRRLWAEVAEVVERARNSQAAVADFDNQIAGAA